MKSRMLVVFAIAALSSMGFLEKAGAEAFPFLVILDPGHGGSDTGAVRRFGFKKIAEKDIALSIAHYTKKALSSLGIPSVLTRRSDAFIPLDQRTRIANEWGAKAQSAVFVSIHVNSSQESRSAGVETYVFNAATNDASARLAELENGRRFSQAHATLDLILADLATTSNFGESASLACHLQQSAMKILKNNATGIKNRGIRQALFYVLMQTRMPSVLFESGFISNARELARLTQPGYQKSMAQALSQGIIQWQKSANPLSLASLTMAPNTPSFPHSLYCQIH